MFDSNKKIVYQDTLDEYHKRISALIGTGGSQISTIPTASEDYENVIYQYIGETDSTYTNGYFYKCIEDPDNAGEYIWVNEQVQDGGSSDGGHEIEDSSYSTEEKIVGTWIDGKPIYQKTFTGLSIALLDTSGVSTGITLSDVSTLISAQGIDTTAGSLKTKTVPLVSYVLASSNVLEIFGAYCGGTTINVLTVQYTKTTDA